MITKSGNGALKFTTSGNNFVDQFGSALHYREIRTWESITRERRDMYPNGLMSGNDAEHLPHQLRHSTTWSL